MTLFCCCSNAGFMVGAHRIAELSEPYTAVPRGMLAAIGTSSSLCTLELSFFAP